MEYPNMNITFTYKKPTGVFVRFLDDTYMDYSHKLSSANN